MAGLVRAGQATGVHGVLVDGWARQSRPGDRSSGRWLGSSEQAGGPEQCYVSHLLCFTFALFHI